MMIWDHVSQNNIHLSRMRPIPRSRSANLNMRIIIHTLLVVFIISCNDQTNFENRVTATAAFNEELIIGNDSVYLLSPRFIENDDDGNIYIADEGRMEVLKFSSNGSFLGKIGSRGRGPGEFNSIRGFYIEGDEILVFDRMLNRVSKFDFDGELKSTFDDVELSARVVFEKRNNYYFCFYVDKIMDINNASFMHVYDSSFTSISSHLDSHEFGINTEQYMGPVLSATIGDFVFLSDSRFLFVPPIYNGSIYVYQSDENGNWTNTKVLNDGLTIKPTIEEYSQNMNREPDAQVSLAGDAEPTKLMINNSSKGIYKTNSSSIIHFTTLYAEGEKRLFGFEKYNSSLEYEGYYVLIETLSSESFNWDVVNKDDKDRFYIIDRTSDVLVRVISIDDI